MSSRIFTQRLCYVYGYGRLCLLRSIHSPFRYGFTHTSRYILFVWSPWNWRLNKTCFKTVTIRVIVIVDIATNTSTIYWQTNRGLLSRCYVYLTTTPNGFLFSFLLSLNIFFIFTCTFFFNFFLLIVGIYCNRRMRFSTRIEGTPDRRRGIEEGEVSIESLFSRTC